MTVAASFSRSAITLYAGAQTGWATLFSVIVVAVALLWLMPLLYQVPQAVLAAVVMTAILGLIKPRSFAALWRVSRVEGGIALATFALTVLTAPAIYWGVLGGLLAGKPVERLVVTHYHPDHVGAAAWLCGRTGAELAMGETEYLTARVHRLATPGDLDAERGFYLGHGLTPEQLAYAASDVLHLHALWARLEALLVREERLELAEACFAFLPARARLDLLGYEDPDIFAH